jgi:hypothetical protein
MVADGKAYDGSYDKRTKAMDVNIEGQLYKGTFVLDASRAVGSSFAGGAVAFGSASSTTSNARALLVAADNRVLRCQFAAGVHEAVGVCVDASGKSYDLIAGE